MVALYLVPPWFYTVDIILQLIFAFMTALVAYYAFKIYNLAEQRESRLLGTGFLLIALSYIIKAIVNLFILRETAGGFPTFALENLKILSTWGVYAYIILFTTGLITLAYLTFHIKSKRAYTLLLATNIAILILSSDKATSFNLLSSLLTLYIALHYALVYYHRRNPKTLILLLAFLFLFISGAGFILMPNYYYNYIISHILEFLYYILMLISLGWAMKGR